MVIIGEGAGKHENRVKATGLPINREIVLQKFATPVLSGIDTVKKGVA